MDHRGLSIDLRQLAEHVQEQPTVLPGSLHPVDFTRPHVQGARQIAFLILARSPRFLLLALAHPVQTDLRIQMDIDLVFVHRGLVSRQGGHQLTQGVHTPGFYRGKPRTLHAWTRIGPSRSDQRQGTTHRRHMNANASLPHHGFHEHFPRPGRPTPTVVLGTGTHDAVEQAQEIRRQFFNAVVLATVPQRGFPAFAKAFHDAIDGGVMDAQDLFDLPRTSAIPDIDDDEVAHAHQSLPALAETLQEAFLDEEPGFRENKYHGNPPWGLVDPESCAWIPIFYSPS